MSKAIALLASRGNPIVDSIIAYSDLPLTSFETTELDLPYSPCPYKLPRRASAQEVVVTSGWLRDMDQAGRDLVNDVLVKLRNRFDRVFGVDEADPFLLTFSDEMMSLMDVVFKINGIYLDSDLYNYFVGAATADGRWTEKSHARKARYTDSNLEKMRVSVPAFLTVSPAVRSMSRRFYVKSKTMRFLKETTEKALRVRPKPISKESPPRNTVHFFASLTHIQRLKAVSMIKESKLPFKGGITGIPKTVAGLDELNIWKELTQAERSQIISELQRAGIESRLLSASEYASSIQSCKAVLSVTGYGEVCYRMAEAWSNRRILVCQDLSHVQTLFPFRNFKNVLYCRPDLSDLIELLEDIECNVHRYRDIAEQGYEDWLRWTQDPSELVQRAFTWDIASSSPQSLN